MSTPGSAAASDDRKPAAQNDATDRHVITDKELSECDREQLHLIGHIQGEAGNCLFISFPEGKILACDAKLESVPWIHRREHKNGEYDDDSCSSMSAEEGTSREPAARLTVNMANGNKRLREDLNPHQFIGTPLQSWIPHKLFLDINESIESMKKAKSTRTFLFYQHKCQPYAVSLSTNSRSFKRICIEVEAIESTEAAGEFYNTLVSLGRVMEFYADERIVKNACDTVFKLLGQYDRGMVYQFNDDNSGEVIHEIKAESVTTSYLGMRFPASDIPLPARKLYIKNGLRYIENVNAKDVPIISENSMDLSNCRMRAVSKPHIIYLRNMGIVSSLSVAIVVENELWGLLAFHGYNKPFKPSLHQRIACETINSMVSVKVESIMKKSQSIRIIELSEALIKWDPNDDVAANLNTIGDGLLRCLDADVLVGKIYDAAKDEAEIVVLGDRSLVPGDAMWDYFAKQDPREIYAADTRQAINEMGLTVEDCPASGIATYRDGLVQVMLGRRLRSKDVMWAGNPDEPKLRIGGILCPRNSFDMFMEKARKESRSWSTSDLHVFLAFMIRVCEHSHNRMMKILKTGIEEANVKYFNAINRAKENCEFFAQMSHEIRTPFHGVMGCLNILHDTMNELSEDEIQDLINTALSSGNQMINLLNDILSLSKNRHNSDAIAEDRLRFTSVGDEATQGLKSLAISKHIDFHCEASPIDNTIVVITDKNKIGQIVSNIVNNAIKFSPGGNVHLRYTLLDSLKESVEAWAKDASGYNGTVMTIEENQLFHSVDAATHYVTRLPPASEEQKYLLLSVSDSGCGMKQNELAEMLQPYTQSSRGSNRIFQGTGLGLFICVSLCQQLSGFLACSSTLGVGTVFHIGIPVKVEIADENDVAMLDAPPKITKNVAIPVSGPIAVCDDNVVNVKILKRGLQLDLKNQGLDIEVLSADGGEGVVSLYKESRPSLLFIDYHMPDLDGSKATERIRQYEKENNLKPAYIIIYTADLTDEAKSILLAAGTNEIMAKPPPKGFISSIVHRIVVQGETNPEE